MPKRLHPRFVMRKLNCRVESVKHLARQPDQLEWPWFFLLLWRLKPLQPPSMA